MTNPGAFVFLDRQASRASRSVPAALAAAALERVWNHRGPAPDPEQTAIDRDRRTRLLSGISRLPRIEREALRLVIADGQKVHEARRRLAWPASATLA